MDKNTGIGFVLIAAIVIGFTVLMKPSQEELAREQRYQDSIQNVQATQLKEDIQTADSADKAKQSVVGDFFDATTAQPINDSIQSETTDSLSVSALPSDSGVEQIATLENEKIRINFSTKGGQMLSAQLKDYNTYAGDSLFLFKSDAKLALELMNKKGITLNTSQADFRVIQGSGDAQTLVMRMNYSDSQYIDFIYALSPNSYMLNFNIAVVGMQDMLSVDCLERFKLNWTQNLRRQEKSKSNEQRYSRIHYKGTDGSFEGLSESNSETKDVPTGVKWVAFKDQFFASVLITDNEFVSPALSSTVLESEDYLKSYSATLYFKPTLAEKGALVGGFKYFLGPLDYYMLKGYDDGVENTQQLDLDKLIPLGWSLFRVVNQYFVMPLFNMLEGTGLQMGLVILLLTVIVKIIISPLTYKSFMSSAKMRVLKPQVDEINEKYPGQEKAMERQKAVMQLYNQAGVNPMSGCIPMLLQMPILLALFSFFPSAIELRHESFLWASDLSTYDAIIEWNTNIPLVSSWLGNHISLFCILMTVTNIVYTKFNMDATNTGQQQMPGMKYMMMFMPVVFFFVLNNYPSGLTYYYFLSTLMTIIITLVCRWVIDEEKVLAKLEENKKKPKKKGFMARLQEQAEQAQRTQQQQQKGKGGSQNKKKK
ncbi:membrane protein insertase YidC [Dysgonomonas macrotermitis]|uniref:Membrane protein insertase YidC n=1 Tax=Dysgonomonas macrotermitis TaxID=1346286 RepID=A0A1M5DY85_9BACT|nr:membrane protein insertase YidC [Dysgonomonas macrotermitis]SHF71905.1 YidC/Oxa1 family membrane protein insertase [Dysgonomonas macrotermitis]